MKTLRGVLPFLTPCSRFLPFLFAYGHDCDGGASSRASPAVLAIRMLFHDLHGNFRAFFLYLLTGMLYRIPLSLLLRAFCFYLLFLVWWVIIP
jgi:hypothetical protein